MADSVQAVTFLFSDIEGSTRLWEQVPEQMQPALAAHDAVARTAVAAHRGRLVKTTGDGIHAVFERASDALAAALHLQLALADPAATAGLALRVRCGLHLGLDERRDGDFYGPAVNRAARIMSAAHGGQTLVSQAVADALAGRLPAGASLLDLGRVRLRDLASPEHLHQLRHPRLRDRFPPLRSLEATPNNLTHRLDSFVGRERELAEVKEMLGSHRLLTLLGMGGIGKSRLSVQLAADVIDAHPDGVWLVELAALTDPGLVPQAVASVLGVKEEAGHSVAEALAKYVPDKRLLLILDNCEHVAAACAELGKQLLQAGAGVTLLASSRSALQIAGEATYQVPTLAVPAPGGALGAEALLRHASVRLFVERASAAQAGFRLTADNAAAVADICHRLDGIPLAIELAAARTRSLAPEAIALRLHDRFRLLVTNDRTVLPRQRTLRALIDWSHDLLPEAERVLFRRLAVFAGGWSIEAAEAVAAGAGLAAVDVLDALAQLVEKSLVVMEPGGARYALLDTVRQYAQERLDAAAGDAADDDDDDADSTRDRHLARYLQLAEDARAGLAGAEQAGWLARLDQERENLLAAHGRCGAAAAVQAEPGAASAGPADAGAAGAGLAHPGATGAGLADPGAAGAARAELGLRLVYALRPYWLNRGLLGLGYRLTCEALAREGARPRNQWRCRGLTGAGWLSYFMGRYPEARAHLLESLAIAREAGHPQWVAVVLQPLGMACLGAGDSAAAHGHLTEAVALARGLGNPRELAAAINSLAQFHRMQGALEVAQGLYDEVAALARELGDPGSLAIVMLNLSMASIGRRPPASIRTMLLEALSISSEIGSEPVAQSALEVCAGLAAQQREWQRAARFFGAAEAQAARTGLRRDPADQAFLTPLIAEARRALSGAAFESMAAQGSALSMTEALRQAHDWLSTPP